MNAVDRLLDRTAASPTDERRRFIRRCGYVGVTLLVLGAAGLARGALMGLGGLVLVVGVLAYLTELDAHAQPGPDRDWDPWIDDLEPGIDDLDPGIDDLDPSPHLPRWVHPDDAAPATEAPPASPSGPPGHGDRRLHLVDPSAGAPEVEPADVLVRFRLPVLVNATTVHLAGEFNDWSRDATPLARDGDSWTTEVALRPERSYRYRYVIDGSWWENAWDAEEYVPNEFGSTDSVVHVRSTPVLPSS